MAIAYVNGAGNNATSSATTIAATAANHTTGNTVIVWISNYTGGQPSVSSIADTAGNTYTIAGAVGHGDASHSLECWSATNITGNASNVVTATFSASAAYRVIIVAQYSGLATSAVYDAGGTLSISANGTTHTCNSLTSTQADEVIIGAYIQWVGAATSMSASGSYNLRASSGGAWALVDQIVASTGSYSPVVACNSADRYACMARSFKMAAAGGGTTRGMPFGNRGTAFNGGRTFVGPIN